MREWREGGVGVRGRLGRCGGEAKTLTLHHVRALARLVLGGAGHVRLGLVSARLCARAGARAVRAGGAIDRVCGGKGRQGVEVE